MIYSPKERITIIHCVALCAVIIGGKEHKVMLLMHKRAPWYELYFGYLTSVMGAVAGGFVFVFIRLSTQRTPPIILVYSHGFFCLLVSLIVGGIFQKYQWHHTGETIVIMVCFGLIGYFGQWTMNKSTQLIPAAAASLIRSSDSVFSYAWQVVFFSTIPTLETIIGAVCVIFGVFLTALEKLRKAHANTDAQEDEALKDNRKMMLNQYGTMTTINSSSLSIQYDEAYTFASNLSLDPNDSHINLLAIE